MEKKKITTDEGTKEPTPAGLSLSELGAEELGSYMHTLDDSVFLPVPETW